MLHMHQTSTACHTPRTAHTLRFADTSKNCTIESGSLVRSCRATTPAWQPLYFCSCHALPEQLTGLEPRGLLPPPLPRRDPGMAYGLAWLGLGLWLELGLGLGLGLGVGSPWTRAAWAAGSRRRPEQPRPRTRGGGALGRVRVRVRVRVGVGLGLGLGSGVRASP